MPVKDMVELGLISPDQALAVICASKGHESGQGLLLFALLLGLLAVVIAVGVSAIGAGVSGSEASVLVNALQQ